MEAIHSFLAAFDIFGIIARYFLNSFSGFVEIFERSFSFIAVPVGRIINSHPSFYYSLMMAGVLFGAYHLINTLVSSRLRAGRVKKTRVSPTSSK
jgi:hypothetical protein